MIRVRRLGACAALSLTVACGGESGSPSSPTPPVSPSPSPSPSSGTFGVSVLVETTSPRPARAEIDRVMLAAAAKLLEKTGQTLGVLDVADVAPGSATAQVAGYVAGRQSAPPDGIVLLSNDATSATFGGYSITVAPPFPFQNGYPSPVPAVGSSRIYVGVIDFDHMYARCGYDDNLNHVSNVSIGGECRNRPGTPCMLVGAQWTCTDTLNDLYADHDYFSGCSIVREFLHPFGSLGSFDHDATPQCIQRTGMTAADAGNLRLAQESCGMCPDLYPLFRRR